MQIQAEFFPYDTGSGTPLTRDVFARHQQEILSALAMLLRAYGLVEARLEVVVPYVFPECKINVLPIPDLAVPEPLRTSLLFIAPSVLRPLMMAWGIGSITVQYTKEQLDQLRDHMKSLVTGVPEEGRFSEVPLPKALDPAHLSVSARAPGPDLPPLFHD